MEWFADEDFWRELYPIMFGPVRFESAARQITQILELTCFSGMRVLDLCCGPGRHSVPFAKRGMKVTGVDLSQFLLDRAREQTPEGVNVEWIRADMRHFRRPAAFDLACSLWTSFGYFQDEEEDLEVLRNIRESLVSGGIFVMGLLGKERIARIMQSSFCDALDDGTMLLQRPVVCADWTRIREERILIKGGSARSFTIEFTIYSGRELKDRLREAGFREITLYGDLDGRPYDLNANRLVAVAPT